MRASRTSLRRPLLKRLIPLVYALFAVVGLLVVLTWIALKIQVALAGFLNGESAWSKAQKEAVIELDAYADSGKEADLKGFRRNYAILVNDRFARDALSHPHYDHRKVVLAMHRGTIMAEAIPGMIFMMHHVPDAPYIKGAMKAWRATDAPLHELKNIADRLQRDYRDGRPARAEISRQRVRMYALNKYIEPLTARFSLEIARGASWLGRVLFISVLSAACIASLLWLFMAQRILARIRGTEERYRLLFDHAADAIVMIDDADDRILDVNRTAAQWSGQTEQHLVGGLFSDLFVHRQAPWEGNSPMGVLKDVSGHTRPVETQSSLVTWGNRIVRQAILRDVSERVAMEQERRIAAQALASIAEGVIIADAGHRVISVNKAHVELTGFTAQSLREKRFQDTRTLPDGSPLPDSICETVDAKDNWVGEVLSQRSDGSVYPELLSISAIRDTRGEIQRYVAVFTNITTAKANRERLEHLATHDALTSLVNRSEFERYCDAAVRRAEDRRGALAVLFVDLDNFKIVNDSFSHAVGDRLLVKVAERLLRQLPGAALAGRIGGDEFTVLLDGLKAREEASTVARRLIATLSEPFVVDDYDIVLSASIGIAGYPLDGADTVSLIANADAAMYAAKTEERNTYRFYSPRMHADSRRRLRLATDLRLALERDEFHLVYQPSIELRSGRIVAVEALLRWQHPERGAIAPDEFIPIAERLGLIRRIDEWVMQAVCKQAQIWQRSDLPPIRVAFNVSASWFGHPGFLETLKRTLQPRMLKPELLMLEITESAILALGEDTRRTMLALKKLGVGVAIDDFGTGYSSLAYLKLPAVAYLKIDRSFVNGLPDNTDDVAIVEATLAIARSLGLCAIAEGVEDELQHEFLVDGGCVEAQGYLYARPLPATDVERLLRGGVLHQAARLRLVPPKYV